MSDAVWPRLAAAFPAAAVVWEPVEVAASDDQVRVVPRLAGPAVRARLDEVVGVPGWSVAFTPFDGGAVGCQVTVLGVTKAAVAAAAAVGGADRTAELALVAAAEAFGMRPAWVVGDDAWVACDPETRQPLHPPEVVPRADETRAASPAAAPEAANAMAAGTVPQAASPAPAPAPVVGAPGPAGDGKPTGQQMIDRLVERLKEEGQGLQAARLLVRYGGYGKDPDAARELYAQLRELLRQASTGASADGAA